MREKTAEELDPGSVQEQFPKGSPTKEGRTRKQGSPVPEDVNSRQQVVPPRFPDDYAFAQQLVKGTREAWGEHFRRWKTKSALYIERRYPGIFNNQDKENILQEMEIRLLKDDRKNLRAYEGMQSLSKHIEQQLEWTILTELRNRAIDLLADDECDGSENVEAQDTDIADGATAIAAGSAGPVPLPMEAEIPQCIMDLPDMQRWVYLLRYYDDFGFPGSEIALVAKQRAMPADKLARLIEDLLEPTPTGQNVLTRKREDLSASDERIQKRFTKIYLLSLEKQKLEREINGEIMGGVDVAMVRERLREIGREIGKARRTLELALGERGDAIIETSYEVIGQILGEENMNTLRGRLLSAKKKLARVLFPEKEQHKPGRRRPNR